MKDLKTELLKRIKKVDSGCWEWLQALRAGYGVFKWDKKNQSTHRLSYSIFKGPIPEGLLICHKCDNRKCINPDHLFLGTYSDNMKDAYNKGRIKLPEGPRYEKGHEAPNKGMTKEQAFKIKQNIMRLYPSVSLREIASMNNVSYQALRDMRRTKPRTYYNI